MQAAEIYGRISMQAVAKWLSVNLHAGVYCVGCGSDLTSRSTDRRSLQSFASEHVATVCKALLEHIVDQEGSDTDIDVDEIVSGARICRKCFTAYEHYQHSGPHQQQSLSDEHCKSLMRTFCHLLLVISNSGVKKTKQYLPLCTTCFISSSSLCPVTYADKSPLEEKIAA